MKIVVTGAKGLLGSHATARIHAYNCAAKFRYEQEPYELIALDRPGFMEDDQLMRAIDGAIAVLHFAGVNRVPDDIIEAENADISHRLVNICNKTGTRPHIVYANSTHYTSDTCLLYTSPSPRDRTRSRMPSSA